MPGRNYSTPSYRYGFNGKEKDDEVKGDGVQYDYGFRIYDARIAKFLSVDPLTKKFPWLTPFQFAANTPIMAVDVDGREAEIVIIGKGANGSQTKTVLKMSDYRLSEWKAIQSGFFGGYSHSEKTEGFSWTSGYKEYTLGMGTTSSNSNGYTGPGVGTLTIDATGGIAKLSYDAKSAKNLTPKSPPIKESLAIGAKAFNDLFISPPEGDKRAQDFNKAVKNVLAVGSLAFGGEALLARESLVKTGLNMAADVDQLTGYSDGLENKELKGLVKTVEFGVGLWALNGDASSAFKAPTVDNVIQTTAGVCASTGDAAEAVSAVTDLKSKKQ